MYKYNIYIFILIQTTMYINVFKKYKTNFASSIMNNYYSVYDRFDTLDKF